ncbi:hypothetical protein [Micromonospora kangleipakensis]|uniref:hypothetical protein n=1 Tax=Micromonospora kangleipakensis TaxID=1077942 RepID=UPI001F5F173A|nr:hypothetical protein [Micromonospora kangleipakensis]
MRVSRGCVSVAGRAAAELGDEVSRENVGNGGYLGVDPKYRLLVSPRLRSEFGNGEQFYAKAGTEIAVPERRGDRPHSEFLEWHLDTVYKAA